MNIIPFPRKIIEKHTEYRISGIVDCRLQMPQEDERIMGLIDKIWPDSHITISAGSEFSLSVGDVFCPSDETVQFLTNASEGYYLNVNNNGILVFAMHIKGLFYGIQTLRQIVENNIVFGCEILDYPDIAGRSGYYDLRQTFPKFELLLKYIEMMAEFKTNTLVIEYEDKIPFEKYPFLRHEKHAFSAEQLDEIKRVAWQNFVDIIPLQQSFGHLEYVLKHPEFSHLRETESDIGEMCPLKPGSMEIAKALLTEMINFHPESEYIHLGCDEVWSLCSCENCKTKYGKSRERAFIDFLNPLIDHVCAHGKKPIIWHDMLEKCSDDDVSCIDKRVTVMIWLYRSRTTTGLAREITKKFMRHGIAVLGASAVRCHDGMSAQNLPVAANRIANTNEWATAAKDLKIPLMVGTNWATEFTMGAPYGIFETSVYTMLHAADKFWNTNANNFLKRFLRVFHGINVENLSGNFKEELNYCTDDDYYFFISKILGEVTRNKDIAMLIDAINTFEGSARMMAAANAYIYRYKMFRQSAGDMVSLKARASKNVTLFKNAKAPLQKALEYFLPPDMASVYVNSRYFANEFLIENFYEKMFVDLE